jgi:uncharacterized membrane protein
MKTIITFFALSLSISAMAESDFSCAGTEPFWGLNLIGSEISLTTPATESAVTEAVTSRTNASGTQEDFVFVATTATATATILSGECSDGMSDEIYSHHIVYNTGDLVLYGCCNKINL